MILEKGLYGMILWLWIFSSRNLMRLFALDVNGRMDLGLSLPVPRFQKNRRYGRFLLEKWDGD